MYKHIGEHGCIDSGDLRSITSDLLSLHGIADSLLSSFNVVRATSARTVWLNERWLSRRGVDLNYPPERERISTWFAREFGYVVDDPAHPSSSVDRRETRAFHADRYGSNNGLVAHGGSGRAAAVGHFHAKGVGVTPLVGRGVNREHSHGAASLNVALRETIYAEIAGEEFPHGAIPTVAIIDTGLTYDSSGSPPRKLRRSIIVRPAMLRTAHLQRAAGFIEPVDGHPNSQLMDARRVRDMVNFFVAHSNKVSSSERMNQHFERLADQIAFGQVHRIYNGGYFSSNVSLDAALLDFGNMHVLPNWVNAKVLDSDLGFGREMLTLEATVNSLDFHFRKYAGQSSFNREAALERAKLRHKATFSREALRVFGLTADTSDRNDSVLREIRALYEAQQRIAINYTRTGDSQDGWIDSAIRSEEAAPRDGQWIKHFDRIVASLARLDDHGSHMRKLHRSMDQRRFLEPRQDVMRSTIQQEVDELLAEDLHVDCARVTDFIDHKVSKGRRHWRSLPGSVVVEAHSYRAGSSILRVRIRSSGAFGYWIEGIQSVSGPTLLGHLISENALRELGAKVEHDRWSVVIEMAPHETEIVIGDVAIAIPAMDSSYAATD